MIYVYLVLIFVWAVAFAFSLIRRLAGKWFLPPETEGSPDHRLNWSATAFFDLLFFSLLPGLIFIFFYPVVPLSGFHFGVALGVSGFLLGAGPAYVILSLRKERSAAATVYDAFFHLCKMLVCFGLIGALYPR